MIRDLPCLFIWKMVSLKDITLLIRLAVDDKLYLYDVIDIKKKQATPLGS